MERRETKTIRIAMLAEYPGQGQSVDGGVQAVSKYLVDALADTGDVDVHVIDFDYDSNTTELQRTAKYCLHTVPASRLGAFSLYRRDQALVDAELRKINPDIVHSQGAGHYGIVATRSGYPTVITIHGIMSEEAKHAPGLRKKFRRWLVNQLSEGLCIRRPKNTILISPYVGDYYGARLAGRKFVIPNPVAPRFFALDRQEQAGRILFAGRILPLKGIHDLLGAVAAASKHSEVELVLAGSLDNRQYVRKLRDQAAELGMAKAVHFRGILNEAELLDEFSHASILVLPSYQETAPMVIQEAMAAGLPVIASKVGGIPHQIEHGNSGLIFEPGDRAALCNCIRQLLEDESMRRTMAANARQRAEKYFRADYIAAQTIETYRQVLAGAPEDA